MPPTVPDYSDHSSADTLLLTPLKRRLYFLFPILIISVISVTGYFFVQNLAQAPDNFPRNSSLEITSGSSISTITKQLQNAGVVKSDFLLYVVLLTMYKPEDVKASTYTFTTPLDVYSVASLLVQGDFNSTLLSFTHIEGERASHVAENAASQLTDFSAPKFLALTSTSEGKLFPETYHIPKDFTERDLFDLMLETYEKNIAPLREQFKLVDLSEAQVIILASIIEREANSPESMKMVSGILQNRLRIGMGLQVDASMEYILDKPLKELTAEDLKMDSPYNTYLYRGLPPTAIGNPGLDAIKAVLEPTLSDKMFYITGSDGEFYYAKTFDEHKANVAKYLR